MMEAKDSILSLLPGRLKVARQSKGMSLDAVSKLSGVSRSMVSQIERGESSPTISILWNLTKALQVDFAGLLDEAPDRRIQVLRNDVVPTIESHGSGCVIRILSAPEEAGRHEVYDLRFTKGGALHSQPHTQGTREHLTVIDGSLVVTSGETAEHLSAGDTAWYSADVAHCITANGPTHAFLVVNSA